MSARIARLRGDIRACVGMFRMKLIEGMQYRAAAWAGIATQFAWGFMLLGVYHAFYRGSTADPGMPFEQLAAYIWLQQGFLALFMLWFQDNELLGSIASGTVAYELCRPVPLYGFWFARLVGKRLASVTLRLAPILLIAAFLPPPFRLMLPPTPVAGLLFLLSVGLSALLVVGISMFIYILTFITLSPTGGRMLVGLAADFLAGSLIPLPLMPQGLQRVLEWLPFRYTFDLPLRLYSGNISGTEALGGIAAQILWIVLLVALGAVAFQRVLRRTVIQGG